jgi:hypothetical protein
LIPSRVVLDSKRYHDTLGFAADYPRMNYLPSYWVAEPGVRYRVKVGDQVVTSGQDQIFPKDLPVGVVSDVKPGPSFKQIRVRPSASLEKLEEVIVLLTTDPLSLKQDTPVAGATPASPSQPAAQPISGLTNPKPAEKHP